MSDGGLSAQLTSQRKDQTTFLIVPGVNGNCKDDEFGQANIVVSWQFNVAKTGGENPTFDEISLTMQRGEGHTALLALNGKLLAEDVRLVQRPGLAKTAAMFDITLTEAILYKTSGGTFSGSALEYDTWTIRYNKIKAIIGEVKDGAHTVAPVEMTFDNVSRKFG